MRYLEQFKKRLEKQWKGSLVSVAEAKAIEPNARKYLSQLAQQAQIEKIIWGWYWVPEKYRDFFDFLGKEQHFKVVQKQTAGAFWNGDFIHRDVYRIAVRDRSYGMALEKLAGSHGWKIQIETKDFKKSTYQRVGRICVERLEDTIVDCVKEWAFTDAFASLHQHYKKVDWDKISRRYWERLSGSNARVGSVLKYATSIMNHQMGTKFYSANRSRISDGFIKRQIEEAAEKVVDLA
jgi:predicted transcriptional regulator of viral defense system